MYKARSPLLVCAALIRAFMVFISIAAIAWVVDVIPKFWTETAFKEVAANIIAGETYRPELIDSLNMRLEKKRLRPSMFSQAAIIRLSLVEHTIDTGEHQNLDRKLDALNESVVQALTSEPTDPFQWLIYFWLKNYRYGFKADYLDYLKMSYVLGPYEAWIALRRNRLALAIFPNLPADIAEFATSEFVGLVRSRFISAAADIVAGAGWPVRHILFARLKDIPEQDRRSLARNLYYDKKLDDVGVPGIDLRERRPWR